MFRIHSTTQLIILVALLLNSSALSTARADDLTELSLENLMDLEVTSVSKKKTKLSDAAAAVFVLTSDDIRRSGATSLPELLRQVPGINVAQAGSSNWAVSARGFNDVFAQKLLVLIDGRSVYTPLFSGVLWDEHSPPLYDIDRIEVIRGPGASLWGANAVNGVINIITKDAEQTQGALVEALVGNEEKVIASSRYGFATGENTFTRVYSSFSQHDEFVDEPQPLGDDEWENLRGGFRSDSKLTDADKLTVLGDINYNSLGSPMLLPSLTPPYNEPTHYDAENIAFNVLSRWEHQREDGSSSTAQVYYDRDKRDGSTGALVVNTVDADLQNTTKVNELLDLIYGANWRLVNDDLELFHQNLSFSNPSRSTTLLSGFLQSDIHLIKDRLNLIVGTKAEHNDNSGVEVQPNVRLAWTPDKTNTFWTSVTRAVRTPSRIDQNLLLEGSGTTPIDPTSGLPILANVSGSDEFESEDVLALEAGYRTDITSSLSFDLATFYNIYDNLRSISPGSPVFNQSPVPHLTLPSIFANELQGDVYGAEVAVTWALRKGAKLTGAYSYLQSDLKLESGSSSISGTNENGSSPQNQLSLRALFDLTDRLEFDTYMYYVDSLPTQEVSSYVRFDTRLGWRLTESLEASFVIQNLFDKQHSEFGSPNAVGLLGGPVERSFYGRLTWHLDR